VLAAHRAQGGLLLIATHLPLALAGSRELGLARYASTEAAA
jgi:ABC-type transport system involved in cytochrome c biogenesis ATPase subunit